MASGQWDRRQHVGGRRNARGPSELNLTKSDPGFTRSAPLPSRGRRIPSSLRESRRAAGLTEEKREERREQREG